MANSQTAPIPRWIESATVTLLALAGVLSAWASFQATLWSGLQDRQYALASARSSGVAFYALVQEQHAAADAAMVSAWLDAATRNDAPLMATYEANFRPDLKPAVAAWRSKLPNNLAAASARDLINAGPLPRAPLTEAAMAQNIKRQALDEFAKGERANDVSDRYVASTVVLATVLFLGGISSNFDRRGPRIALVLLAACLGVAVAVFILRLPLATF